MDLFNLIFKYDEFECKKKIGEGSFGTVYLVGKKDEYDDEKYAAKVLNRQALRNEETQKSFLRELAILQKVDHPAIEKLYGINFLSINNKNTLEPTIITEYFKNGTLDTIIKNSKNSIQPEGVEWNATKKLICLIGIADAMRYLHKNKILHRDLKPLNILLDDKCYPKIIDFGLSRYFPQSKDTGMSLCGTPLYMAPELYNIDGKYDEKVDVFAFAIIAYQIFTANDFYDTIPNIQEFYKNGHRPDINLILKEKMKTLISHCWSQNPDDRPTFDEIVNMLMFNNPDDFIDEYVDPDEINSYIYDLKDYRENKNNIKNSYLLGDDDCNSKTFLEKQNISLREMLKNALSHIPNVSNFQISNEPILNYACQSGDIETVKYLLTLPNVKKTNNDTSSILCSACKSGNSELVEYLIKEYKMNKEAFFIANKEGLIPFHAACLSGNEDLVKEILERGFPINVINTQQKNGMHALHYACKSGNLNIIKILFSLNGINANPITAKKTTILHFACQSGNVELVDYLLSKKGNDDNLIYNIDSKNNVGCNVLHCACQSGNIDLLLYLLKKKKWEKDDYKTNNHTTLLHSACQSGNIEISNYIIDVLKCSIKDTNDDNWSVLHCACRSGEIKLFKHLMKRDKDLDLELVTTNNKTILHFAVDSGNAQLVEYILLLKNNRINSSEDINGIISSLNEQKRNNEIKEILIKFIKSNNNCNIY